MPTFLEHAATCPECRAGKHRNCDGTSWEITFDRPGPCPCAEAGHGTEFERPEWPPEERPDREAIPRSQRRQVPGEMHGI